MEKITRKASKKVVERCKGVEMAELDLVEEKARIPCGLDKACQLCIHNGFDRLLNVHFIVYRIQHSRRHTLNITYVFQYITNTVQQ